MKNLAVLFALAMAIRAADLPSLVTVTTQVNQPEADLVASEPFLLQVVLLDSRAAANPDERLTLTCGGGDWSTRLRIEIRTPSGETQNWPWSWQHCPANDVELNASQALQTVAVIAPERTGGMTPGSYFVRAAISSGAHLAGSDLTGTSYSDWQAINVLSDPQPDQVESTFLRRSKYKELSGDLTGALADVNALLQTDSAYVGGLAQRSLLLSRLGRYEDAVKSMAQSAAAFAAAYPEVVLGPEATAVDATAVNQLLNAIVTGASLRPYR